MENCFQVQFDTAADTFTLKKKKKRRKNKDKKGGETLTFIKLNQKSSCTSHPIILVRKKTGSR